MRARPRLGALMLSKFLIDWCARRDCSGWRPRPSLTARDRRRCRSGVQLGLRPSCRTPRPLPAGNQHTPMRIGTKKAGSKPAFFVPLVRPERFELPASWFVVAMMIL